MLEIPPELPLPAACPQCGAEWISFGEGPDPVLVVLYCANWHKHAQTLTAEEVMAFRLALEPKRLLSRPMFVVGENRPIYEDRHMWLGPDHAMPGANVSIDQVIYVVVQVEPDRVWIRRADS
ncbi:MAG: hypothetical protein ABSD97_16015 [Acidimicrobiales bacterium]|jgi:hypothetical protein